MMRNYKNIQQPLLWGFPQDSKTWTFYHNSVPKNTLIIKLLRSLARNRSAPRFFTHRLWCPPPTLAPQSSNSHFSCC